MNIKTQLIATGVRILAEHTTLIRKPDTYETLIADIFGMESYDVRMARQIEEETQRAVDAAKRFSLNRKFKKITKDI